MIRVINPGLQALVEDRGRFGYAASGVSSSGSFDRMSAARANHALGNAPDAPVIEILLGGFEFEVVEACSVIFTGTRSEVTVTRAERETRTFTQTVLDLAPGDRVRLAPAQEGMRAYLAVRGGFRAERVLGSASTDLISKLGPAPLSAGDELGRDDFIADKHWFPRLRQLPPLWHHRGGDLTVMKVIMGPRSDWFSTKTIMSFLSQEFVVSPESNRIGVRLKAAEPLLRSRRGELASEGMVRGSIQVPPSGDPVMFGADHPVTGGYPVIAVLEPRSCDRAAQLAPGTRVTFKVR